MDRPNIDEDGWIKGRIKVELCELHGDFESFLDMISERIGYPLLMQQSYKAVGIEDGGMTLVLEVEGDASAYLEGEEDQR